jgi:hypothetical protein
MADIHKTVVKEKDLTQLTAIGNISWQEITNSLREFYKSGFTTNLLWDFTQADFTGIQSDNIRMIITTSMSLAPLRKNGKTAIVASSAYANALIRQYEIISEVNKHPINHGIFNRVEEAMEWFNSK